jgi:hypothetical protein
MQESTTPVPETSIQPLRKHHFSRPYAHASFYRRGADAAPTSAPLPYAAPTSPNAQGTRKFWVVPERAPATTNARPINVMAAVKEAQADLQTMRTLPEYNHGAVATQNDTPFLVAPENPSERNITNGDAAALALLQFHDAADRSLESRKPSLKGRTPASYEHHISQLNKFFDDLRVNKIHVGHLNAY